MSHHPADSRSAGFLPGYDFSEEFVEQWRDRVAKYLRAQELIVQGFTAAARTQINYQQEFIASRMQFAPWNPAEAGNFSERANHDMARFKAMIHEITEDMRGAFEEAAKLIKEDTDSLTEQPVYHSKAHVQPAAEPPAPKPAPAPVAAPAPPAAKAAPPAEPAAKASPAPRAALKVKSAASRQSSKSTPARRRAAR